MKTSTSFSARFVLIVGVFALMAVYYIGYSTGKSLPANAPAPTDVIVARGYFNKYMKTAPREFNGTVKALVVDLSQYDAMTEVLNNTTGTEGFRIYYGIDSNNQFVRMVVGIGSDGRDKIEYIRTTTTYRSDMCPPVCDSPNGVLGE
jgi:hypothetical protein